MKHQIVQHCGALEWYVKTKMLAVVTKNPRNSRAVRSLCSNALLDAASAPACRPIHGVSLESHPPFLFCSAMNNASCDDLQTESTLSVSVL